MKKTINLIAIAILISLSFLAVKAQSSAQPDKQYVEVSGSYTVDREDHRGISNGWTAGGAYIINKWVSVFGEGGQEYRKRKPNVAVTLTDKRTTFLGGVRVHFVNKSRLTPYGQVGFGRAEREVDCSGNCSGFPQQYSGFAFSTGGGVDIGLNQKKTIAWRTGLEFRRTELSTKHLRFSTGIVFRF